MKDEVMKYKYDTKNIFAMIINEEIPCKKIYETNLSLSFFDINPQAPIHALVIPKGSYVNYDDFITNASVEQVIDYNNSIIQTLKTLNIDLNENGNGYRLVVNNGNFASQEVPHFHTHILSGKKLD